MPHCSGKTCIESVAAASASALAFASAAIASSSAAMYAAAISSSTLLSAMNWATVPSASAARLSSGELAIWFCDWVVAWAAGTGIGDAVANIADVNRGGRHWGRRGGWQRRHQMGWSGGCKEREQHRVLRKGIVIYGDPAVRDKKSCTSQVLAAGLGVRDGHRNDAGPYLHHPSASCNGRSCSDPETRDNPERSLPRMAWHRHNPAV